MDRQKKKKNSHTLWFVLRQGILAICVGLLALGRTDLGTDTVIYSVGEEGRGSEAICLDLCKVCETVQHNHLVSKLERHGLGG